MNTKISRGQFLAALGGMAISAVVLKFESGKKILTSAFSFNKQSLLAAAATPYADPVAKLGDDDSSDIAYHALTDELRGRLWLVKPYTGVRVPNWRKKKTWELELVSGTTNGEKTALQNVIDTFDISILDKKPLINGG